MRLRDIIGLIIALVLAIGVALLTRVFLAKEEASPKEVPVKEALASKILVSGKELYAGDTIKPGDLVWQAWPENALNASYVKEGTLKVENLSGAVILQHLSSGEPIAASDFVKPGEKGILAAVISPGKRAISIDVSAPAVNSGLIFPGDKVDVIMSKVLSTVGSQSGQSRTVARNVKVLALDFDMLNNHITPKTVPHVATLEVSPGEAETITASAKEGTLSLSLHSITASKDVVEKKEPSNAGVIILMRGKERNEVQVQE